jgi:hypothetical protein
MQSLQVFGVRWPGDLEMYDVVGESFRGKEVRSVGDYIKSHAQFVPHRACLVPMADVPKHPGAVGVFFVQPSRNWLGMKKEVAVHVGFLPSDQATKFRRDMKALGHAGFCMECAGCVMDNEKTEHPSVRIYVPLKFATLAKKGFLDDRANYPAWLKDTSPVVKRSASDSRGGGFSDDELRKVFCYRAQQRGWYSLPDKAEQALQELRQMGAGLLHFALQEYAGTT